MKELRKVIWAEGMFLGQQHFQLWDRYYETYQNLQTRSISPMSWGVLSLSIDEDALENGQYRVTECQVIFPDGRLVSYDASFDDPLIIELQGGYSEKVDVYLCLPANRSANGITGYRSNGQLCAWEADYRRIGDENDPAREREVMLGKPNLMLLDGSESRENFTWLKLTELVNEGDGRYKLVTEYIPPLVRVGASPTMLVMLQRFIELFSAKVRVLNERRRQMSASAADFGHSDVSNFLVLQALSGAIPILQHFRQNPELHPEQLYQLLARVIGSLCPFSFEIDVHSITRYRHGELTQVFQSLEHQLRTLIDVAMPSRMAAIKLTREADSLYSIDNIDSTLFANCTFFIAVYAEIDDPMWVMHFERMIKVGARADIEMIVASALPGAKITHSPRPPSNLPIKSGYEYFRIEPRGTFWDKIVAERTMGIFVPREFVKVKMEVVTVQE
jgi:type VI secretion system protein ImpJ